jgi:hypothetical protein
MRWICVVALGLALAGCAGAGSGAGSGQMAWMRLDGKPLDARFQAAADQCRTKAGQIGLDVPVKQREATMKAAMQGCMQQRGYVWQQCNGALDALTQAGCGEGPSDADKKPRPARS